MREQTSWLRFAPLQRRDEFHVSRFRLSRTTLNLKLSNLKLNQGGTANSLSPLRWKGVFILDCKLQILDLTMTTTRLLFGATWRGGGLGLVAGAMGGATYGALFANAMFFIGFITESQLPPELKDAPGAIAAVVILAFIGSVMGAMFGMPVGALVGLLDGLLIGIVTRLFFFPLRDAKIYRRVMALICFIVTASASWVGFMLIWIFLSNQGKANFTVFSLISAIPALIAGVAATLLSRVIARWYERGARSEGRMETPSEATQ